MSWIQLSWKLWFLFMVLRGNNYKIKPEGMIHFLPVTKGIKTQKLLHCSSLASTECQRTFSNTQRSNLHSCTTLSRSLHYLSECETDSCSCFYENPRTMENLCFTFTCGSLCHYPNIPPLKEWGVSANDVCLKGNTSVVRPAFCYATEMYEWSARKPTWEISVCHRRKAKSFTKWQSYWNLFPQYFMVAFTDNTSVAGIRLDH